MQGESVYIVTESVQYEDTSIIGVYEDQIDALDRVNDFIDSHRYEGQWSDWSNGGDHVVSKQNRDVTIVVKKYPVQ